MEYFKRIFKESIIVVILSSAFGLVSGSLLSTNNEFLYMFPIILLILPSLNSLVGNISTVLISRLTAHLYIGTIQPKIERSDRLTEDFYGLLYSTILSLAFLLFIGYFIALFTGVKIVNPLFIILIVSFTVIVLFIAMFIFLLISAIYLFKWGKDPNNFLIPFVTSLNDFLTPLLLIVFIIIFI